MTLATTIDLVISQHHQGTLAQSEHQSITSRGKVRDIIDKCHTLIMINTDRISAFDQVLGTIPLKGALLCEQACYWFKHSADIVPNHLIDRPDAQIVVVKKAQPFLVEVVVRGYLAGSLLREDPTTRGHAYGITLTPELKAYERLEHPIITPSTKAAVGFHDEPMTANALIAANIVTMKQWQQISETSLALFQHASELALAQGLLLVDTKYEFGLIDNQLHLIDEVHTSDSSRFFIKDDYQQKFSEGRTPVMLDKEYLRQDLLQQGITAASDFTSVTLSSALEHEVAKRYFMLTETMLGADFLPPAETAHTRVHRALAQLLC